MRRATKTNPETLQRVKNADVFAICLEKSLLVPLDSKGNCGVSNKCLVDEIHTLGMQVYAYTFKNELNTLCWNYEGDVRNELEKFYMLGIDGYFADYPNTVRSFLDGKDCSRSLEAPNEMSGESGRTCYHILQGIYQSKWTILVLTMAGACSVVGLLHFYQILSYPAFL